MSLRRKTSGVPVLPYLHNRNPKLSKRKLRSKLRQTERKRQRERGRLTATGFGRELSSGQILHSGWPNSCIWAESDSERLALEMKLEPFLILLLTLSQLVSGGGQENVFESVSECESIAPMASQGTTNRTSRTHQRTATACRLGCSNDHPGGTTQKKN